MLMMSENWAKELTHNQVIDFYYSQIKDWYTPKNQSNILVYNKEEKFYRLEEPYEQDDYE
jgi:hypothetical protein